ncbi:MAG TPA: DUF397 domain-containing protein [Streptosporangiaceae bacterium]
MFAPTVSSYSNSNSNCAEVAITGHAVAVRDSKDRHGPVLVFTPGQWRAFTAAIKGREGSPA